MSIINLEKLNICDADNIYSIEQSCFPMPWNLQNIINEIIQPFAFNFKLSINDSITGYTFSSLVYENLLINNICISKSQQNNGYGSKLLLFLLEEAKKNGAQIATLEVNVKNLSAIHLYEKNGFKKNGVKKYFYSNGDNAFTMILLL